MPCLPLFPGGSRVSQRSFCWGADGVRKNRRAGARWCRVAVKGPSRVQFSTVVAPINPKGTQEFSGLGDRPE
jgi:hypothetical protein